MQIRMNKLYRSLGLTGKKGDKMGKHYEINQGYVVLDENMEIVDWFDTLEEAEHFVDENEE